MKGKVFPVSMAVLWGIVFSQAMHSVTLGVCMGLAMGPLSACLIPAGERMKMK